MRRLSGRQTFSEIAQAEGVAVVNAHVGTGLWGMYQWLDRAPLGRKETGLWWRRHDEYDGARD